jgi:outer membrane murein-binding lipoprotein Lpp
MSEENTQNLPDTRSFEERVFARFDAIDAGLRDLNTRVERLEAESERRAVETKPIWERTLAEIVALGQKVDDLSQKVDTLDARVVALEVKVDALQEEVAVISRKVNVIESRTENFTLDMYDLRVEQRELKKRMNRLDSENAR